MIYVLNKNKIISCVISFISVLFILVIGITEAQNKDVKLIKVMVDNIIDNQSENYIKK